MVEGLTGHATSPGLQAGEEASGRAASPVVQVGGDGNGAARHRLERRVGYHHFAFFRAYIEGLELTKAASLYLETGIDGRKARSTLTWIRDELIAAARRKNAASVARLLRIPPGRLATEAIPSAAPLLSLEEFQAAHDPQGFWTEQELIELFEKEIGDTHTPSPMHRQASRNARLRKRLIEAVGWLESWVATRPLPSDPLLVWLDEGIALRLNKAGMQSISDLVATINREGFRWHTRVPKLGRIGAERVINWLQSAQVLPLAERALLSYRANKTALTANRPREFGIVPLEYLAIPPEHAAMLGAAGENRAYGKALAAANDIEAIGAWLGSRRQGDHTRRSYTLHAERFLLWMIFERGKPLSSATVEDCAGYRDFLAALGDKNQPWRWRLDRTSWVAPLTRRRIDPRWKPFTGTLSPDSQKLSITVLNIMFGWLAAKRYLIDNTWQGINTAVQIRPRLKTDHSLTRGQWESVLSHCDQMEPDERYWRLKFLLWLAYSTGMRLSEIRKVTVSDIKESEDGGGFDLNVVGKRNKLREIPIGAMVMGVLADYMEVRGHGRRIEMWPPDAPLVASLGSHLQHAQKAGESLSDTAIYNILVGHFRATADAIELDDMRAASRLRKASTHWMRHTCATHLIHAGIPMDVAQDLLGHESPATTALYVSPGKQRKRKAVEHLIGQSAQESPHDIPAIPPLPRR